MPPLIQGKNFFQKVRQALLPRLPLPHFLKRSRKEKKMSELYDSIYDLLTHRPAEEMDEKTTLKILGFFDGYLEKIEKNFQRWSEEAWEKKVRYSEDVYMNEYYKGESEAKQDMSGYIHRLREELVNGEAPKPPDPDGGS